MPTINQSMFISNYLPLSHIKKLQQELDYFISSNFEAYFTQKDPHI